MVGVVGVQVMGGVASDVVPVRLQKAELRVVQDVEVSAAQSVTGRSDQKVPVMFPRLPPHGEVERGATQLQPRRQQRVTEDLLSDLAEQLNAVQSPGRSLFCQGLYNHRGIHQTFFLPRRQLAGRPTHVDKGVEVSLQTLIGLPFQSGQSSELGPVIDFSLRVIHHSKRRHGSVEVSLLSTSPPSLPL